MRALVAVLPFAAACVARPQAVLGVPEGNVYQGTREAMQYRSPLPRDVLPARTIGRASGESCRTTITFPPSPPAVFLGSGMVASALPYNPLSIAAGDDGYARATAEARAAAGSGRLFDVRADLRTQSFLGIVTRECIEVHAAVAR